LKLLKIINNETRNILSNPAFIGRYRYWLFNIYTMKNRNERREEMAAIGTMILVAAIAIILVINLIYNLI